ncbi:unnamed protein product [Closterium sp. NIES-53]
MLNNCIEAGVFVPGTLLRPDGSEPGTNRYPKLRKVYSDSLVVGHCGLNDEGYTFTFVNTGTRYMWIANVQFRSRAYEVFCLRLAHVQRQSGKKLQIWQTDGRAEFCSKELQDYLAQKGISHNVSLPYAHPQQSVAERINRNLKTKSIAGTSRAAEPRRPAEPTYRAAHLRTSDTRYRVALPAEFCAENPPPMYITLYYLVTRLPDTLRSVRDNFLSLCPTTLTVDLLEERLLAAETSITAVGASRGDPRTPFFEGCSPVPLLSSVASTAAVNLVGTESVSAASAPSERRRTGKGKRGKGTGGGGGGGGSGGGGGGGGGGGSGGRGGGFSGSGGGGGGSGGGGAYAGRQGSGDAWRTQFPDATEIPRWGDLLRLGVAIFDLEFDAILAAMYAVSISVEGDCYVCVPPDPGIEAAALGASESAAPGASASAALGAGESALSGTESAQVLHTFNLDSGASRSFQDRTTLTPLNRPVAVSLADPSKGPVLTRYSTVLPCLAAPSGSLSGLYLPSFSTNLVSGADLQDAGVDQFTPASQRVTHCTCAQMGRHLATFSRRPGSSLYTLTTESPPIASSGQVAASSQVFAAASRSGPECAPCSYRLLSHQTLLWHHRLGHPSLPRLPSMASRVLVSGLPRSLPPLPQGPAPTCVPFVEGRQRAAPHSSEFPPTEAPLQTLHMDVWGPARVRGQGHERYFLLVVDDYSRYTTVFPLRSKGEVTEVLFDWICVARLQLRERFGSDFPGIRQTFTLPASPQQNGIAERRIGMVMDVARTSMIHAAAPHILWPFAVQYAAHQINLQPRVSLPETSPTLRWTGKVGDASAFRVKGSRAFVRDLSADKLSSRAVPCVFLGFPPDAPGWQFYHPTSRCVLSSQDVTFDESVPYYRLFPYRTAPLPPPAALPRARCSCWCNPTVCIRLVVRVRACVCAWNGSRA